MLTAIIQRLHKARVEEAKKEILRDTLGAVGYGGDGRVPDEVSLIFSTASFAGPVFRMVLLGSIMALVRSRIDITRPSASPPMSHNHDLYPLTSAFFLEPSQPTFKTKKTNTPQKLVQTIQITTAQLSGKISPQDRSIVDAELSHFLSEIQIITPFLSTHLVETNTLLTRLANPPSSNLTKSDPTNSNLSSTLSTLQTNTTQSRANLSNLRAAVAKQSASLLALYTTLHETLILLLEQVLHGSISRHVRAQCTYLSLVAQGIEKKILILRKQVLGQVYTADVRMKLQQEIEDVEGEIRVCRGRLGRREGVLGQLEQLGRGLEKCAEDCKALRGEIGKTREEAERLEGA